MKKINREFCPVIESLKIIKSVWMLAVIYVLLDGPKGFNEIIRSIPRLNAKTLSRTLKTLQRNKFVKREIIKLQPFSVKYSLTQKGKDLKPVFESLRKWGSKWA
ncbi:MAG: helix-turn-helix transcriptional regulator [Thaumarchaeota archaeon]|jgi:DNA-binding HxlR family transcriptional regulator|nr:helix-turn-helix transcriptional regulator [Candidatus Geocrenenecus arthurdayi]MCL7389642.1 helix-turn-helix transcriptional regulator [Candidatus Geocrenenecus arthurdayi]MCL7391089.1 helix-turn-helix transcriptional regulator [Candidatus Geocrenenecus arthurdayi]MCL7396925.1 helix-turn-helix transcriptional regulator [Candidatus Geocrenenecus arthurdayi]MCL7402200.1 helix-turn-helix transcriptional regulator [Candidatus Geocrenenecus arthurdayi]